MQVNLLQLWRRRPAILAGPQVTMISVFRVAYLADSFLRKIDQPARMWWVYFRDQPEKSARRSGMVSSVASRSAKAHKQFPAGVFCGPVSGKETDGPRLRPKIGMGATGRGMSAGGTYRI